jgi:hypothetical protein
MKTVQVLVTISLKLDLKDLNMAVPFKPLGQLLKEFHKNLMYQKLAPGNTTLIHKFRPQNLVM